MLDAYYSTTAVAPHETELKTYPLLLRERSEKFDSLGVDLIDEGGLRIITGWELDLVRVLPRCVVGLRSVCLTCRGRARRRSETLVDVGGGS